MNIEKDPNKNLQLAYSSLLKRGVSNTDILYLFSFYISSNPDYKYNSTYLTDSIDDFNKAWNKFKAKHKVFKTIIQFVKSNTISKSKQIEIDIIFDSVLQYNTIKSTCLETFNDNFFFLFSQMSNDSFSVKFICEISETDTVEYVYEIDKYDNKKDWMIKISGFIDIIKKLT
jgi:hypothetical protein